MPLLSMILISLVSTLEIESEEVEFNSITDKWEACIEQVPDLPERKFYIVGLNVENGTGYHRYLSFCILSLLNQASKFCN